MKLPLSQLKPYLDSPLNPEEISKSLTQLGIEVEDIEAAECSFNNVIVAKIEKREPHPNADRLCLATVYDGEKRVQVVCGAPNCQEGLVTAFAPVGASLTDKEGKKWVIKASKLRGVMSEGMLCSADELGLSEENEGILSLPSDTPLGMPLSELFLDPILDISLTPNLSRCLSARGIARELAAFWNKKIKALEFSFKEEGFAIDTLVQVEKEDLQRCPRYLGRILQNVVVSPSPEWLQTLLKKWKIRSINNIVDITNFVMMHLGIPLHAFDLDHIQDKKIKVTTASAPRPFLSLEGNERWVPEGSILIEDAKGVIALGGIMGGERTKVTFETKNIFLEAAFFQPQAIRKTSKALDMRTEAALRFEKGVDPRALEEALDYASFLIQSLAGGSIAVGKINLSESFQRTTLIPADLERINQLLGLHLSQHEVQDLLARLEIKTTFHQDTHFTAEVPSYRLDLKEEVDLSEEVARLYGYQNIPLKKPYYLASSVPLDPLFLFEKKVRSLLVKEGLQEVINCDLISPLAAKLTLEKDLSEEQLIEVIHPRSMYHSVLRMSLLPGLLDVAKFNGNHGTKNVHLFEIGNIHFKDGKKYEQESTLGILMMGSFSFKHWDEKLRETDFFDLKGILENFFASLDLKEIAFEPSTFQNFHPHIQAAIFIDKLRVGALGQVHPEECLAFNIEEPVFYAELNLKDLLRFTKSAVEMKQIPIFPGSTRDWTVTISENILFKSVLEDIKSLDSPFLEKIELIDLYKSDKIGKDKRNITLRFFFRDWDKTIDLETVEREYQKLLQAMGKFL